MMQVQLFSSQVAGDHVRVEEYSPGKLLRVVYWRVDSSQHHVSNPTADQSSSMLPCVSLCVTLLLCLSSCVLPCYCVCHHVCYLLLCYLFTVCIAVFIIMSVIFLLCLSLCVTLLLFVVCVTYRDGDNYHSNWRQLM